MPTTLHTLALSWKQCFTVFSWLKCNPVFSMTRPVSRGQSIIHVCSWPNCNLSLNSDQTIIARLFRVSLFIDFGCLSDLGIGWRGAFGTFMVSRPTCISQGSDWWKFIIWNEVMEINQSDSSTGISIWTGFGQGFTQVSGKGSVKGLGKCLGRVLAMLYMDAWIIMLFHRLILCIWKV